MRLNPHNLMVALDPPRDHPPRRWRCRYCGLEGLYDELEQVACSYVYPPCEYCGETPECSLTCEGVARALSGEDVYIATGVEPWQRPKA